MFEKSDIENMLKQYLVSKSQVEELKSKIDKNNVLLEYSGKNYEETEEEAISNMTFCSSKSEIPTGKTNKITNNTERIALTYKSDLNYTNKCDKLKIINENERYNRKLEPLEELVNRIDRMLSALNNEQKLIITTYYMYEPKWNYVSTTYLEVYKEPRTVNQLKNIRDAALDIMLKVINV